MSIDDAYIEQELNDFYINNFGDSARKEMLEDINNKGEEKC